MLKALSEVFHSRFRYKQSKKRAKTKFKNLYFNYFFSIYIKSKVSLKFIKLLL
jgi:hypothetical protein